MKEERLKEGRMDGKRKRFKERWMKERNEEWKKRRRDEKKDGKKEGGLDES